MFKHIFERIEGIGQYPLFSLLVFLTFFIGVGLWAYTLGKPYVAHMGQLPLDEQPTHPTTEVQPCN